MHNYISIIIIALSSYGIAYGQCSPIHPPVEGTLRLSGSFGELRSSHFHAGIDIKSPDGKGGHPIYAICEGYISRIAISSDGYGRALYIDHPDGHTSVYAHLDQFSDQIAQWTRHRIQELQTYTLDVIVPEGELSVVKGQLIGTMGNTGRSYGAHLHFEIRNTETERPLHPLDFGLKHTDELSPRTPEIYVYGLNAQHEITYRKKIKIPSTSRSIDLDTLKIPAWRAAVGIYTYDQAENAPNKNGIYELNTRLNGESIYHIKVDSLDWATQSDIHHHVDYELAKKTSRRLHKGFLYPQESHIVYIDSSKRGIIPLYLGKTQDVNIQISDYNRNITTLQLTLLRQDSIVQTLSESYTHLIDGKEINIAINGFKIQRPAALSYIPSRLSIRTETTGSKHELILSGRPCYWTEPLELRYPDSSSDLCYAVYDEADKGYLSLSTEREEGQLLCRVNSPGRYAVFRDTIAPTAVWQGSKKPLRAGSSVRCEVNRSVQTDLTDHAIDYNITLDGNWIWAYYDAKNDRIELQLPDNLSTGEHLLVINIRDAQGNERVVPYSFKTI